MSYFRWIGDELQLQVLVQPQAAKDQIVGVYDNYLKIKITSPPIEGKANAHLIKFLAKYFGVAKSRVELKRGEHSRFKEFSIRQPMKNIPE